MLWTLCWAALASVPSVPKAEIGARVQALRAEAGGVLVVGNWETAKPVGRALAEAGLQDKVARYPDSASEAMAQLAAALKKEAVPCGLYVAVHDDATYALYEVGTCHPAAAPAAPTGEPASASPAPATPAPAPAGLRAQR